MTTNTPGPRCSICTHADRELIEAELMAGTGVVEISGSFNLSTSAISRHSQRHLVPVLREAARGSSVGPTDLLERLSEIADDARDARRRARDSGTPTQQARATDAESRVLFAMLQQLGIKDLEIVATMKDAERLAHGVARFAIANPGPAQALIRELENQKLDDFADQLQQIVSKKNPPIEGTAP